MSTLDERLTAYLAWLDERTGREPDFTVYRESGSPVTVISYIDLIEEGTTLAFTFGVSEPRASDGTGVEFVLHMHSLDRKWRHALGVFGETAQAGSPEVGDTCDLGEPLADDTTMSGFVLTPPFVATEEPIEVVHLGDSHLVLRQAVPLYSSELRYLREAADRGVAARRLTMAMNERSAWPARPAVLPGELAD